MFLNHIEKLKPYLEDTRDTGAELLAGWCQVFFKTTFARTEKLTQSRGSNTSDAFTYGIIACISSMYIEAKNRLPHITTKQFIEIDREYDRVKKMESAVTVAHFEQIEGAMMLQFPITMVVLDVIRQDLERTYDPDSVEMLEGWYDGWYWAMSVVITRLSRQNRNKASS